MVNKRKRKTPVRYVNPNRRYPSWPALDIMYKHYRVYHKPKLIDELKDLVGDANELYHESILQWPFDLENSQLYTGISRAKKANFFNDIMQMHGKPGWWNPTPTQEQQYWRNFNNAVQHDFKKHLNYRETHEAYEKLDNHVMHKFKW